MQFLANVLIIGILCPLLTSWLVNRLMQKQRVLDQERHDSVLLFINEQQNFVEQKIDEFTKSLKLSVDVVDSSFRRIEDLVNTHITQMIQSELAGTEDTLVMMKAFAQGQHNIGIRPTVEMQAAIREREDRNNVIRERLRAREKVDV